LTWRPSERLVDIPDDPPDPGSQSGNHPFRPV
jgi:hypothetical protein